MPGVGCWDENIEKLILKKLRVCNIVATFFLLSNEILLKDLNEKLFFTQSA